MQQDKYSEEEISQEGNVISSKLSNFWYHYKWYVIVIGFFLVITLFCVSQCARNEQYDLTVIFAGPVSLASDEQSAVKSSLSSMLVKAGIDGHVGLQTFLYYSDDTLEEMKEEYLKDPANTEGGVGIYMQTLTNARNDEYRSFSSALMKNDGYVLIIDRALYDKLVENEQLVKIESIAGLDVITESEEYGIPLGRTAAYQSNASLQKLPDDCIVCLLKERIMTIGGGQDHSVFENSEKLFVKTVTGN